MKFNNIEISQYISDNPDNEVIKEFERNCQKMLDALESIPEVFQHEKMETLEWANLSIEDPLKANEILKDETERDISFLKIITSFKLYHLFNSIVNFLEKDKDYEAICLLRVLLENICFLKYSLEEVNNICERINTNTKEYLNYHKCCEDLEKLSNRFKKGTKIENLAKNAEGAAIAKSILNAIDFVSKLKGYETIRAKYDILCDFVHPNYFSNSLFGIPTEIKESKEDLKLEKERILLIRGETSLFLKTLPPEFRKLKIRYLGMIISVLDMCISLYLESLKGFDRISVSKLEVSIPIRENLLGLSKEERMKFFNETYLP